MRFLLLIGLISCGTDPADESEETCPVPPYSVVHPGSGPPAQSSLPLAEECSADAHDAMIVLGCPSNSDGSISACQRARIEMALQFWDDGLASWIITTGGPVQNEHVEAFTLRDGLIDAGVPEAQILPEPRAEHTDENLAFSAAIMDDHELKTALVVSDPSHLLYTAVCDATCCVRRGRLTTLKYAVGGTEIIAGHWDLEHSPPHPLECEQIKAEGKFMCVALPDRRACAQGPHWP